MFVQLSKSSHYQLDTSFQYTSISNISPKNLPKMAKFIEYQRGMWTKLSYLTVARFYIIRDQHGNFVIKKSGRIRTFLYYLIWVNSLIKISYLVLNYHGWLVEVHFLDQMSMWDWFLCFSQLVQETNLWYRKYPLFETLHANWKLQEEVFRKLDSERKANVESRILTTCKSLVYMHSTIVFVGCGALMIQFAFAPKYALNTFAVVPYDNLALRVVFAAHEYFYMFHIWSHQASSIVLLEVFAVSYTHIITAMAQVMQQLSEQGQIKPKEESTRNPSIHHDLSISSGSRSTHSRMRGQTRISSSDKGSLQKSQFIPDRILDPMEIAQGTQYDVMTLLMDYKKVMIAAREFNVWAGKWMGGTTMSNYGQFISDVFMMIQLLKEPETDIMGVFFFFEDACAGMAMLFRMLILLSRVYPASENFMNAFKSYAQHETPQRKYLRKYEKTLRIVAAKIGGYSTNPKTVPKGINCLFNYYIGAAMWQRPVDRKT